MGEVLSMERFKRARSWRSLVKMVALGRIIIPELSRETLKEYSLVAPADGSDPEQSDGGEKNA